MDYEMHEEMTKMERVFAKVKRSPLTLILMAYVFLTSGLIVNFLQFLTLPLWYLGYKQLYRKIIAPLNYSVWCMIPGLSQWWAGIDCYIYARPEDFESMGRETTLVIMNHKAQLDWVMSWVVADYCGILRNAKCMAKSAMRYVPVIGWGFWYAEYIFLKRKLEEDRETLRSSFKALASFAADFMILVFCEGTRYTPEKHKLSMEFAEKRGLKPLKHHLIPRTKGFYLISQGLRDTVDTVYDCTVSFRINENPSFKSMLEGKRCIGDFLIRRMPISDVPTDEEACTKYVHDIFVEKDDLCEYHIQNKTFPIGDASSKYKDFIRRKVSRNPLALFFLWFWSVVTLVPLVFYSYQTFASGSAAQIAALSGFFGLVTVIFYLMIQTAKPLSSYGGKNG